MGIAIDEVRVNEIVDDKNLSGVKTLLNSFFLIPDLPLNK